MTNFDWPAFLAARLDELDDIWTDADRGHQDMRWYMQADIAAKRAILNDYDQVKEGGLFLDSDGEWSLNAKVSMDRDCLLKVIKLLCRPFADHPDYPSEEAQ